MFGTEFIMVKTLKKSHHVLRISEIKAVTPYTEISDTLKSTIELMSGGNYFSEETPEEIFEKLRVPFSIK